MTRKQMQCEINKIVKWIAYKVFKSSGSYRFAKAYDRLIGRVYLDHELKIAEGDSGLSVSENIFNGLTDSEMELVLESAKNLQNMYNEAFEVVYI